MIGAAWQHKWLVISIVALGTIAAIVVAANRPSRFEASASIVFDESAGFLGAPTSNQAGRAVANELEILRSGAVLERTIEILDDEDAESLTLTSLRRELVMSGLSNADVITISYVAETPELAEAVTSAVIQAYQDVRASQREADSRLSLERLDAAEDVLIEDLETVRSEIAGARADRGFAEMIDTVLTELSDIEAELLTQISADERTSLLARQDQLRSQLQALEAALTIESTRPDIEALLRRENQILTRLSDLEERRSEIEIQLSTQTSGVAFISPPTVTAGETGATRLLTALAGAVLGLLIALAVAYTMTVNRRSFSDRHEPAEVLGSPFLADIPRFDATSSKTNLPVRDNPRTPVAEAFRFATASLELRMERMDARVAVGVSGAVGDGKSTVLANIALAAARTGKRVLVVDADFGNQAISKLLLSNFRLGPGLTELVAGKALLAEAAVPIALGQGSVLHLISRGREPVTAPTILSSPDMRAIIDRMTDRYDLVFLDGPPLTQVAYGSALARFADVALVVVAHGSPIHRAADLRRQLEMIDIPQAGYVYNKAPIRPEMLTSGGSMKDVIGDAGTTEPLPAGP